MTLSGGRANQANTESCDQADLVDGELLPQAVEDAMNEYYRLQRNLLYCTLALTGIVFLLVWGFYSVSVALNYLIGACTGVVYLKMLAKDVSELGKTREKLGAGRLALFILLIVVAAQIEQLEILPVFFGFLTYKLAVLVYTLWSSLPLMSVESKSG